MEKQDWVLRPTAEPVLWPIALWIIYMYAVLQLDVVLWLKFFLLPLLLPWILGFWCRYCALTAAESVVRIEQRPDGWYIYLKNGDIEAVQLAGKPWLGMNWLGVCWRNSSQKKRCAIVTPIRIIGDFRALSRALLATWEAQSRN